MKIFILILFFMLNLKAQVPSPSPTVFVPPVAPKSAGVTDWSVLLGLNLKTNKTSEGLNKLLGKKVKLLGFMVPLDYDEKSIKEFLLIPTPLSCTHLPPPESNQMVLVKIPKGKKAAYYWGAVYTSGTLSLAKKEKSMQEAPSFEMLGDEVTEYTAEDGAVKLHSN